MGVPKRGNKRKKDNQKPMKKKADAKKASKRSELDGQEKDRSDDRNKYVDDEFKCLKEVMKIKNLVSCSNCIITF